MTSQNQRMEQDIARIVARSEASPGAATIAEAQTPKHRYRPVPPKIARKSVRAAMPMNDREFKEYTKKELSWLTKEQKEAFVSFSRQGLYGPMNTALRNHANPPYADRLKPFQLEAIRAQSAMDYLKNTYGGNETVPNIARAMDAAFRKSKTPRDMMVYRGVNYHSNRVFHSLNEGDMFTDAGYMSTSIEPGTVAGGVADSFTDPFNLGKGGTLLKILVPKGSHAIAIPSDFEKEREVLLPRGSKFRITKISPGKNDGRVIDMTMQ